MIKPKIRSEGSRCLPPRPNPVAAKPSDIEIALSQLNVDELSPRAALDFLYEMKAKLDKKVN